MWTAASFLKAIANVHVFSSNGRRAVHKPLLILLAIANVEGGGSGIVSFPDIEARLEELIAEFGNTASAVNRPRAHYPFWYLRNDGFWFVEDEAKFAPRKGKGAWGEPSVVALRDAPAKAGFLPDVAALLTEDRDLRRRAVVTVLEQSFPETRRQDVIDAVGLTVRDAVLAVRDPKFRQDVLREYGYRCAICGFDGRIHASSVGLEAAHIKMLSFGGPNDITNGLALCSLHHKLFDAGAITIEPSSYALSVSARFAGLSLGVHAVIEAADRPIRHLPIRETCRPAETNLAWHRSQVFVD